MRRPAPMAHETLRAVWYTPPRPKCDGPAWTPEIGLSLVVPPFLFKIHSNIQISHSFTNIIGLKNLDSTIKINSPSIFSEDSYAEIPKTV